MPILSVQINEPGQAGVTPGMCRILTNDTLAEVIVTGYLNHTFAENIPLMNGMMALVQTKPSDNSSVTNASWLAVTFSSGNWSLTPTAVAPGSIATPTIANHLAVFTDTIGSLGEDVSTAIQGGNIQAGLSGTAGYVASFPATASKGSLHLTAVANTGDTLVTLSNVAHGQASVYSIPDAGNAIGRVLVGATATPFTTGHLLSSSGTGGVVADSGVATTALQLKANIKAATTANIGGTGAGPLTVSQAACTSSSVIVCQVESSSNPCYVITVVPGTGSFTVTTNTDPGASLILSYVLFVAAQ